MNLSLGSCIFIFILEKYTYHEIFMCTKKYNRYDIIGIAMNEQNKNKTQKICSPVTSLGNFLLG